MIILGVDTSTDLLGAAIVENEKVLVSIRTKRRLGHSDYLIPLIDKALGNSRLSLGDIDGFAVSKGPGSFTGLRIGVTAIRAFSLVTKKPIVGVPTPDVISYNAKKQNSSLICPVLDAKQNNVYACVFKNKDGVMKRQSAYLLLPVEKLAGYIKNQPVIFLGDGIRIYGQRLKEIFGKHALFLEEKFWYPDAAWVARLGYEMLKNGKKDNPYDLVPLYLYPKECTISIRRKK